MCSKANYGGCSQPGTCDLFFFFNDPATTEIYTLPLHDALPISSSSMSATASRILCAAASGWRSACSDALMIISGLRSEEHTSELQSQSNLVCRLLLEKKKQTTMRSATRCLRHSDSD